MHCCCYFIENNKYSEEKYRRFEIYKYIFQKININHYILVGIIIQ